MIGLLRIWPWAAFAVVVLLLAGAVYHKGYQAGADAELSAAMERDLVREQAAAAALAKRTLENAAIQARHEQSNLKDAIAHENADLAVERERDRLRLELRRAGGLRIALPPAACRGLAAETEARPDGQPAARAAGTVALPDQVESDLLAFAADADKVVEQARAMQKRLVEDAGEP